MDDGGKSLGKGMPRHGGTAEPQVGEVNNWTREDISMLQLNLARNSWRTHFLATMHLRVLRGYELPPCNNVAVGFAVISHRRCGSTAKLLNRECARRESVEITDVTLRVWV